MRCRAFLDALVAASSARRGGAVRAPAPWDAATDVRLGLSEAETELVFGEPGGGAPASTSAGRAAVASPGGPPSG